MTRIAARFDCLRAANRKAFVAYLDAMAGLVQPR